MKKMSRRAVFAGVSVVILALYGFNQLGEKKGYNKENLDTSVNPCADFYTYAIGGWQKRNPIPSTESRWAVFNILAKQNEERVETILDRLNTGQVKAVNGSPEQQVKDYYKTVLDSASRNAKGIEPIQPYLDAIELCSDKQALMDLMASWQQEGIGTFFSFYVGSDAKNSNENRLHLSQSGLHLPDVDYYLKDNVENRAIQEAYVLHVGKMLDKIRVDEKDQKAAAKEIFELEKELALVSMSRTERRDPDKTYNKYHYDEFLKTYNGIDWKSYFAKSAMPEWQHIIVAQPDYLANAIEIWKNHPIEVWKNYLRWELISSFSGVLSLQIEADQFAFYAGVLKGTAEMKPFKERAVKKVNGNLGELVGQLFVKEHFSEDAKKQVSLMVEEIRDVFRERIAGLDWMSDTTKGKALEKLNAFKYKIGYPDKWRDYSGLDVNAGNLFANDIAIHQFNYRRMMDKLGKPVDKGEWGMTPQTVNAYYSSGKNEIVFPAGILQPPFYDPNAEDALNYGGIGAVIGHEFSHGFDDKGSKFDAEGNLNNWWTEGDRVRFTERTQKIVAQFENYQVLDGVHINGSLTQGENIADLAGLTLAYYALQKHYGNKAPKGTSLDGFTWKQRFFLGWAQVWAQNIAEKELRNRIITDPHSPGKFRVLGPLSNLPEFWEAFACKEDMPMVVTDETRRVVIW
ncbi:MAG TPA: M13 family peptidase [Bacteroidetes bacterium]|nr:M13 family peptidase [Bacteroidota bacterium]